ncbi:MAG: YetF domain-containing protein [Pricia sp.]
MRSKLREANVTKLSEIKAVIFETTGNISVLHKDNDDGLNLWLMKDVRRS